LNGSDTLTVHDVLIERLVDDAHAPGAQCFLYDIAIAEYPGCGPCRGGGVDSCDAAVAVQWGGGWQ
jgi:hypothetical protein